MCFKSQPSNKRSANARVRNAWGFDATSKLERNLYRMDEFYNRTNSRTLIRALDLKSCRHNHLKILVVDLPSRELLRPLALEGRSIPKHA
jgi:hypothetical protein